jgi:hypothetical protein
MAGSPMSRMRLCVQAGFDDLPTGGLGAMMHDMFLNPMGAQQAYWEHYEVAQCRSLSVLLGLPQADPARPHVARRQLPRVGRHGGLGTA